MPQFIAEIEPYLEILALVSNVVLAIAALYGLQQIRLLKLDMRIRNERSAKEKAIEGSNSYFESYVPLSNVYFAELKAKQLATFAQPNTNFSSDSIPSELKKDSSKRVLLSSWAPALNKLETISATFTTGVADEQTGFLIIGRTYCQTIMLFYDILVYFGTHSSQPYYQNIVKLYRTWAPRLSKQEMMLSKQELDAEISSIEDSKIPPIGSDLK